MMRFTGMILMAGCAAICAGAGAEAAEETPPAARPSPEKRAELERLDRAAMRMYRQGDLDGARAAWEKMLAIRPGERRATTYLEETRKEAEKLKAAREGDAAAFERATATRKLLDSPVTIATDQPMPIAEFLRVLSFSTAKELEYSISAGGEGNVSANFVDRPLRDVLDEVLPSSGLEWRMDENGVLVIRPALRAKTYSLTSEGARKARALLDSGDMQRAIWGQTDAPGLGAEMKLDERTRSLTAVGTTAQHRKLGDFLASAEKAAPADLETNIYKIREEDGPKVKSLIAGIVGSQAGAPTAAERKVFVDKTDLIVRDTPQNIAKIEELLLDEKFIEQVRGGGLELANFSLVPRDAEASAGSDQIQVFTTRVVEAIETFLYARTGKKSALAEGRRLWFDPATLQLTVVDTAPNIAAVGRFIESLPELRQKKTQKTLKLEYQTAEEMATQLSEILGASAPEGRGAATGDEVVRKLRRGDQFEFKGLRIRLMRVEEGDPNDRNDDECELQINTGTQVNNLTLRELDTQFFEDAEITAEDIQPAGGSGGGAGGAVSSNRGEGTVRLRVRLVPAETPGKGR